MQSIREFAEQDIDVLHFKSREELTQYGETYAKVPLDLYGLLCEIKIILQKEQYGILVKLHHIIGDAWTMALICNQFQEILSLQTQTAQTSKSPLAESSKPPTSAEKLKSLPEKILM